jgi:hypothetical protein
MKTIEQLTIVAACMLICFAMTQTANGAIEIRLAAEKTEFKLGEPVVVFVSVTNKSQEPLNLSPDLGPEADFLQYLITNPDGRETAFSPLFVVDAGQAITLGKDETASSGARIFYGGDGYSFPKAGKYIVVARYKESRSNALEIRVLAAASDAEREQAKMILDHPEVGLFLMLEGGDELADAKKQIDALISKHPTSILTNYVRYAVAKNLSTPAKNFVSKKPRPADIPRSIEMLQGLKDKDFQFYYQSKANSTLATSLAKLNRKDEARKVLQDFRRKLEGTDKIRPYYLKRVDEELEKIK